MPGATGSSWPAGARVHVQPGAALPEGLSLNGPVPCSEAGVSFWILGGPGKGRARVVEDASGLLMLGPDFTVGLRCRAGPGVVEGHDSLLLGHDNKHWLAVIGGHSGRALCVLDANSGQSWKLDNSLSESTWCDFFLRSKGASTSICAVDADGLVELGVVDISLSGSKLRSMGWAGNELHISDLAVWDRSLTWQELTDSLVPRPLAPPADLPPPKQRAGFRGRVVDLAGNALPDVRVSWSSGGCSTDDAGYFKGESTEDVETEVPEDAASAGSGDTAMIWTSLSFTCEGFAPTTAVAHRLPEGAGDELTMQVLMRPISASAAVSVADGGSVVDPVSGSSVTVPPGGLTYPDGSAVEGPAIVSLSIIDATDPASLASMPGDFSAIDASGSEVFLESLGAAWIGATDEQGRELVVAEGSGGVTLDLRTQASANAAKLGVLPEMWSFDESTGKWVVEPSDMKVNGEPAPNQTRLSAVQPAATGSEPRKYRSKKKLTKKDYNELTSDPSTVITGCMSPEDFMKKVAEDGPKSLSANITKLGYINCDLAYHHPQRAVMIQGQVLGPDQQPLPGLQLWGVGKDYNGRTPDKTDGNGCFGAMISQFDSEVEIEVHVRSPVPGDEKVEVYFPNENFGSVGREIQNALYSVVGSYTKKPDAHLQWARSKAEALIKWVAERKQWQLLYNGKALFAKDAPEEPGLPYGGTWRPVGDLGAVAPGIPPPAFAQPCAVAVKVFGPFKTGPPGEFVNVGILPA